MKRIVNLLGAAVLTAATAAGSATALSSTAQAATAPTLSKAEVSLLNSSTPRDLVIDARTGEVLSVKPHSTVAQPMISHHTNCSSTDACFEGAPPYVSQGFSGGAGISTGSWPGIARWDSGNYTTHACWRPSGSFSDVCSRYNLLPHAYADFTEHVTGREMQIY